MGYKKVLVIFDDNKKSLIPDLKNKYKNYEMIAIPTDDVRTKKEKNIIGLINSIKNFSINEKYKDYVENEFLPTIKSYFENNIKIKSNPNEEIKVEVKNKFPNEEVQELINIFLQREKNKFNLYTQNKYPEFIFRVGGGGADVEKISENVYEVTQKCTHNIDDHRGVSYERKLIVNLKDSRIKVGRIRITKNNLPINILKKLINKFFINY